MNQPGYSCEGYRTRAEECTRLANLTADALLQAELLKLRQTYLVISERLRLAHAASYEPLHQSA